MRCESPPPLTRRESRTWRRSCSTRDLGGWPRRGRARSRKMTATGLVTTESVERAILVLRGRRVILDSELAALYGVTVSVFNQAVKRNMERFPADFAFQLTREEYESLSSQIVILEIRLPAHPRGVRISKITICDLKGRARRSSKVPALCVHRARRG